MEFGAGTFIWGDDPYPFVEAYIGSLFRKSVFVGLPQWGINEWRGSLYSEKCPTSKFLFEYAQVLDCVEVSSTFYANVSESTLKKWQAVVPEGFHFLPKWPQRITHDLRLRNCQQEITIFAKKMETLGGNLGVTILQMPRGFSTEYRRELFQFFKIVPENFPVAIEFRHSSWFKGNRVYRPLEDFLSKQNIGMVCSDTPQRRDLFHLSFCGSKNVIRYLSDQSFERDAQRLEVWRNWLSSLDCGGLFYFTFHRPENTHTPALISLFNQAKASEIAYRIQSRQQSLF